VLHPISDAGEAFDLSVRLSAVSSRESVVPNELILWLESQAEFLL